MANEHKTPDGLLSLFYHIAYDAETKKKVLQANGLQKVIAEFGVSEDIGRVLLEAEKSGIVRATDRATLSNLLADYLVENYNDVYTGIW